MLGQAAERKISQKGLYPNRYRPFSTHFYAFGGRDASIKVWRFIAGGSGRFLRAADIIANNAQQEEVAVVLSAREKPPINWWQ